MSEPTYEELLTRNNQLARLIVGMTDRLEGSKKELMATAWVAGVRALQDMTQESETTVALCLATNPYAQRSKERGL